MEKRKDALKPLMLIDLLAILPFYLQLKGLDLRILRTFRLLRILRMFKLARYFDALQMIGRVISKKRYELISIFGVLLLLMFISSFLMFYAESNAQPDAFRNILSGIIVLIGIMLFALPTSILTAEFLNEYNDDQNDL